MNVYLPMAILIAFLFLTIYKNRKNKTTDAVLQILEPAGLTSFAIRLFSFITIYYGVLSILNKGNSQINIFWVLLGLTWFYLLTQKRVVLQNGIGIMDIFKNASYFFAFKDILAYEAIKEKKIKISYVNGGKNLELTIAAKKESIEELLVFLQKTVKIKKKK